MKNRNLLAIIFIVLGIFLAFWTEWFIGFPLILTGAIYFFNRNL